MPRSASPHARSRNGVFGPTVASRSCGPEPCTSTTAASILSFGSDSVPGSAHSPLPTVTGCSVKRLAAGGVAGAVVAGRGVRRSPAILSSASNAIVMFTTVLSNWHPSTTAVTPPGVVVSW